MRNAWLIARLDLLIFLRSRGNLLQLLLIPVILTLVLGYALARDGGGPQRIRLDLLDEDRSARSAQLAAALLSQGPALRLCPVAGEDCDGPMEASPSLTVALERLSQGAADALLHIPPGFGAALAAQQQVTLPLYTAAAVPQTDPAWNAVQAALQRVNGVTTAAVTGRNCMWRWPWQRRGEWTLYRRCRNLPRTPGLSATPSCGSRRQQRRHQSPPSRAASRSRCRVWRPFMCSSA